MTLNTMGCCMQVKPLGSLEHQAGPVLVPEASANAQPQAPCLDTEAVELSSASHISRFLTC